jgi:two-component system OmpR family sensor kinase
VRSALDWPSRTVRRLGEPISGTFDRLPIRIRLAGVSALLTFVILCAFALVVGSLTVHRLRSDFNRQVAQTTEQLATQLTTYVNPINNHLTEIQPPLNELPVPDHSVIKVLTLGGELVAEQPKKAPSFGVPRESARTVNGYRIASQVSIVRVFGSGAALGHVVVQYGRRVADVEATVHRVELLLLAGVFAGAGLALLAGMMIARRAMAPIAQLTSTAAAIARTRDASRNVPLPEADDEVAELARTLQGMLRALDAAQAETETMLTRQRQFVADASHELRTPLTSVLANLELLAESLHGEQGEAASSALRSSQRMRRLVADLLLLARTDVGRVVPHQRIDLAQIVVEAAAELGPVSTTHEISLDVQPVFIDGVHDELHRLVINLIENALRHTPDGTEIQVSIKTERATTAVLVVQDDGPGVDPDLAPTLFERFVRGAGDRGGSFGLGLAIVRAVAHSHGGGVTLEQTQPHGARFVVRLPVGQPPAAELPAQSAQSAQPA